MKKYDHVSVAEELYDKQFDDMLSFKEITKALALARAAGLEEALGVIEVEQENVPPYVWSHMRSIVQSKIRDLKGDKK